MENSFDATTERECSLCFFDLHLSAAGCQCSPDRFACLNHSKQLCSCDWDKKFFLFRYDITELNLLVDALEGKLSAVYRWARLDLGLALSSCISKNTGLGGPTSDPLGENTASKTNPQLQQPIVPSKSKDIITKAQFFLSSSGEKGKTCDVVLGLEATKIPPIKLSRQNNRKNDKLQIVKDGGKKPEIKSLNVQDDIICLSDDDDDDQSKVPPSDGPISPEMDGSDHKLNLCDLANAALAAESNLNLISDGLKFDCMSRSTTPDNETKDKCETIALYDDNNLSCHQGSIGSSIEKRDPDGLNSGYGIKFRDESVVQRVDDLRTFPGSPSCSQSSVDKYPRSKGPRIAKVVRRINCNVELLEIGVVVPGNVWSCSRAIFPKGFKSRVRYINISEPTSMSNYISEILDGGSKGPLFMVFLEDNPNEVFINLSPTKCWEMVRERVNVEITKHHKMGKTELSPLQPPGSLDGLEMFGFTSPPIVQAIEALDKNRVCAEYWSSRPFGHISQCFQSSGSNQNPNNIDESKDKSVGISDMILKGFFKKANLEELQSLTEILGKNRTHVISAINEELENQSK